MLTGGSDVRSIYGRDSDNGSPIRPLLTTLYSMLFLQYEAALGVRDPQHKKHGKVVLLRHHHWRIRWEG